MDICENIWEYLGNMGNTWELIRTGDMVIGLDISWETFFHVF